MNNQSTQNLIELYAKGFIKPDAPARKMLIEIINLSSLIREVAMDAYGTGNEKKRDELIVKIIKLHEKIDDLLSSPWH